MRSAETSDLWWKNAIFYCVDVESFQDSDGDGVGDLVGLANRIDYLAGLGVTCLWLMPFFPSPEQDFGYDVTDYYGVNPRFGSAGDFVEVLRVARERGIRVIADLVVNHTSVEHPWFQAARRGDPRFKDFYVWSKHRPAHWDQGVSFPGRQHGIWSYDRSAREWYMHRFHDFQPDLNINNPVVRNEIQKVVGYWIDLGLSGFRMDAVPFVIEQVDPRHPAVSDPHDYLRDLRDYVVRRRGDAMFLAEANEPLDRIASYFGERGNQMDMLFNFIVNEAMYLGFVRHDARPLAKALGALPRIPAQGQWANFVKNHDEESLDRLTDAEREEVFAAFGPRKTMQLYGRGIRRRFPPMVEGDRRRMELAYSLVMSLPGAPVLLYGEEIGMGDNLEMPDRAAIRVPMQWSDRPGGGFSSAPERTWRRKAMPGGPFGYCSVNVEAQRHDPDSFLNWMSRAIRTRREWPEFGWGTWRVLRSGHDSLLAHLSTWGHGSVLTVHNFGDAPVRTSITIPKEVRAGRWRRIFANGDGDVVRDVSGTRITDELPPYGYAWYGRRDGVI